MWTIWLFFLHSPHNMTLTLPLQQEPRLPSITITPNIPFRDTSSCAIVHKIDEAGLVLPTIQFMPPGFADFFLKILFAQMQ